MEATTGAEANQGQLRYWNGPAGQQWAAEADRYDRMLASHTALVLRAADLSPGEHVLDVGCGGGDLTLAAARAVVPGGAAIGVDLSEPMLAVARRRAASPEPLPVSYVPGDAQSHDFGADTFDVVVSRNGLMLFDDPVAAFANLHRALRPEGRLAFVTWAEPEANAWSSLPVSAVAAHLPAAAGAGAGGRFTGPFGLADDAYVRALLGRAGFVDVQIARDERDLWVAADVDDAVGWFERSFADARGLVPPDVAGRVLTTLRVALAAYARPDGVWLPSAAWVVRARAAAA